MAKIVIDTESPEAVEYLAYLMWMGDNNSLENAREYTSRWNVYVAHAKETLEKLAEPIPTPVYTVDGETGRRYHTSTHPASYEGISVTE